MIKRKLRVTDLVRTWTAPGITAVVPIVHQFELEGRVYYVVCTRCEPAPPILAIRERDQLFEPDDESTPILGNARARASFRQ